MSLRFYLTVVGLNLALVVSGSAENNWSSNSLSPYSVSVHLDGAGQEDRGLKDLLRKISITDSMSDTPPSSQALLEAFARDDADKMELVLRSKGYYSGSVRPHLEEKNGKPRLVFTIDTGPPFLIDQVTINLEGPSLPAKVRVPQGPQLGLTKGIPGTTAIIISASDLITTSFQQQGYPFVKVTDRKVVVEYDSRTIDITFKIRPGQRATFGEITVKGLQDVSWDFVQQQIPWKEGDFYDPNLIQQFRNRLSRCGLFSTIFIAPIEQTPETKEPGSTKPETIPVTVTLKERKRHTLGLMAGYSTDLGFGGAVSWEDRNLFGKGESFRASVMTSEKMTMVDSRFTLPAFLHPDQSLILSIKPIYDKPDAYTSYRIRGSALIQRILSPVLSLSGGVALTQDQVEQLDAKADFTLLSLPLDAQLSIGGQQPFSRAGALLSLLTEPYLDLHNNHFFIRSFLNLNLIYNFPWWERLRGVGRISFGSIPESSPGEVPADLRMYAGGVNSIRGYSYQSVGPLQDQDPIGGRSLLTYSLEFDLEVWGDFGAAVFLDGGGAFAEMVPQFNDEIVWGTGGGLRYFTPIGPIGLDIGFPLNKRTDIDKDFQVYVSIAQIF